jgi:hypothetical protein
MPRSIALVVGLFVAFTSILAAGPARADPPSASTVPVYVLALWTEDADDQADALTRALRWRVQQAPGWSLVETSQSLETLAIALKCPPNPDAPCLQRVGDQLKADHYVWGTMERRRGAPGQVSVELHLWTRGQPGVVTHASFSDSLKDAGDEALRTVATRLFGQLTGSPQSTAVESPAPPSPEPARPPEPSVAPPPAATAPSSFRVRAAIAYTALAVGAGLLVVGGAEAIDWLGDRNGSVDDRRQIPKSVSDVCADMTREQSLDACTKSNDAITASTLAWIFAGAGAVLAGTGVWLLATDHPSETTSTEIARGADRPRLEVLPALQPRAGRLVVRLTF